MNGDVASPPSTSEAGVSPADKKGTKEKKEKQVCSLCNVEIPAGPDALQHHEAGKRHVRMRAQCDAVEALAKRSVFIKIAPNRPPSPVEMEMESIHLMEGAAPAKPAKPDVRLRLQREEIERVMARFGHIERVLCRAENGHFAIVEYGKDEDAKSALAARSVLMSCSTVGEDGATGPIKMAPVLVTERRVAFSAAAPIEKHRINVDEIVDALSRLIIDPAEDGYTTAIDEVIRYMVLSEEQLRDRAVLAARLETELKKYFVAPSVTIFGSSITSIGTVDSDIDMCLTLSSSVEGGANKRMQFLHEQKQRDKYTLLTGDAAQFREKKVTAAEMQRLSGPDRVRFVSRMLNEVRKECGWMGVQRPVVDCRLPIVRFLLDREVLVDLSVDNAIGVAKSAYIRDLIKMDASGKLRRILIGLRFWALSNGLFEAQEKEHKGHFNAYMLNLLVIAHLRREGAGLPPYQESDTPVYGGLNNKWRIDFVVPPYSLERVEIHAFIRSFFIYMSETSLSKQVFVGRTGLVDNLNRLPELQRIRPDFRKVCGGTETILYTPTKPGFFECSLMNLQDPIELSHNVTMTLNEKYVRHMRHMMMRSLHAMKANKNSFVAILSVEKRMTREETKSPASADVSMGENGRDTATAASADSLRPLTAMVEPVKADATVAVCYPRDRPVSQSALMRAAAFVFEKVLLADELEDPTSSAPTANGGPAKRARGLTAAARDRAEKSRAGAVMKEGRADGEATPLVSASSPPPEPALYNWGIYAIPARLWIGRRNVKRKLAKEHAGREEIEIESLVSHELLEEATTTNGDDGGAGGKKAATVSALDKHTPCLVVRVEFGFHSDAMMMRFHRLEGEPLDLTNASHFLEGNGLLPKYAHSLLPLLMEAAEEEKKAAASAAPSSVEDAENKRPTSSGGKRKHEETEEPMEM